MAWSGKTFEGVPSWFGPGFGKIADPAAQPAWRDLEIGSINARGTDCVVRERRRLITDFATLTELDCENLEVRGKCLVVTPQSGHFSLLLRDLIAGLLAEHDVAVLDWTNARHIPLAVGDFGFDDSIEAVVAALRILGPNTHLVGVCQSALPSIVAAIAVHQEDEGANPASLTVIGAAVDPVANPTRVSSMLATTRLADIERDAISSVPAGCAGAGRRVFAARTQLRGLLAYLGRHFWQFGPCMQKVINDDGSDARRFPFLTLFTSLKDIPATAFIENIAAAFQDRLLWSEELVWQDQFLEPEQIVNLPLMTVEAEQDDIAAPGQTYAAHRLFSKLPDELRRHFLLPRGGHFSLFHGAACRNQVVPEVNQFMRLMDR